VCWITLDLASPRQQRERWLDIADSSRTIEWTSPEHAVLLTGFSESTVIYLDPHTGKCEEKPRQLFKQRFEFMGSRAVTVKLLS